MPPLSASRHRDVAITGAGITGALIADGLAGPGRRLLLLGGADLLFKGAVARATPLPGFGFQRLGTDPALDRPGVQAPGGVVSG